MNQTEKISKKKIRLSKQQIDNLTQLGIKVTTETTEAEALKLVRNKSLSKRNPKSKRAYKRSIKAQKRLGLDPIYNRKDRRKHGQFGALTEEERKLRNL